jgi:hypothetical protein
VANAEGQTSDLSLLIHTAVTDDEFKKDPTPLLRPLGRGTAVARQEATQRVGKVAFSLDLHTAETDDKFKKDPMLLL